MSRFVKQRDLLSTFGNPSARDWGQYHIHYVTPPFEMWSGKIPIRTIPINNTVWVSLDQVLNEIWLASGKNQKKIHEWGVDAYDGSWVVRNIRGSNKLSNHAFGLAIDFDSKRNPLGCKRGNFTKTHPVVKIFKAHNWRWGGDYKGRKDPMHFEAVG